MSICIYFAAVHGGGDFIHDECYFSEGQFEDDKLKGFGRICGK